MDNGKWIISSPPPPPQHRGFCKLKLHAAILQSKIKDFCQPPLHKEAFSPLSPAKKHGYLRTIGDSKGALPVMPE